YPSSLITTSTRLREQSSSDSSSDNASDVEPTWTYVPYQPPSNKRRKPSSSSSRPRRNFSTSSESSWTIPNQISIPEDQLQITFTRASGAGGQNVNKVNTKVELRFHLPTASWIPSEVKTRLQTNESNRINSEGYMTVTSQEHRTQLQNRKDAMKKLENIVRESWARPKVRKLRRGLTKKAKEKRRENKKKVSLKKEGRRRVDF
ncbi:hypothetical protein ACHAXR_011117, partial [Thalassiosira sp. AJA248-18]